MLFASVVATSASAQVPLETEGIALRTHQATEALDRYMETWNTRDAVRWATSLAFPHVRPGAAPFRVFQDSDEYVASTDFERTLATGWRYSRWLDRKVIQVGLSSIHATGHWKRYGEREPQPESLITYVLVRRGDAFGIQARFAAGAPARDTAKAVANQEAAREAIERYFAAFNSHEVEKLLAAIHFPHVRLGDGQLSFWADRDQFLAGPEPGRQRTWAETRLEKCEVVQTAERGANVAVTYARMADGGRVLSRYEAVLLAIEREGSWKVQASSVLGP